eukprot:1142609-Pelagomonas_calceolata.AAC.6
MDDEAGTFTSPGLHFKGMLFAGREIHLYKKQGKEKKGQTMQAVRKLPTSIKEGSNGKNFAWAYLVRAQQDGFESLLPAGSSSTRLHNLQWMGTARAVIWVDKEKNNAARVVMEWRT